MKIEREFLNGLQNSEAYKTAKPTRAQRPLDTLERTEHAAMVARACRAASTAWPAASGCGTNHGKVFTVSTQDARRTCLTWSRAPTRSEEGGRQRGWSSSVAPMVGEVGHASRSCSEVIGCSGHASGSCSKVVGKSATPPGAASR
jgi:hypothetical protein